MRGTKSGIEIILVVLLITFCIQTTDMKLGLVKISEIILLLIVPFLFRKPLDKYFYYMLLFFTVEAAISLFITTTHNFEFTSNSVLKRPYVITIARYVEIFASISLGIITYKLFKRHSAESKTIINYLINLNLIITIVFVLIYFMVMLGVVPIDKSIIVYSQDRLRGLYVEGGPYGLMLSFIYILTSFQDKTFKRTLIRIFLLITIYFFAESKAGTLCVIFWIFLQNIKFLKDKLRHFVYPVAVVAIIAFGFIFAAVSHQYIELYQTMRKNVELRPTDPNLVMGRAAGVYIAPRMVADRPVFGIGLGNYPLIRNNKEYRGYLKVQSKDIRWLDANGFGGIVDIIVDMGLFGLAFFLFINYKIAIDVMSRNKGVLLLIAFLSLFMFGVQIYFLYPWILLGIVLAYKNGYIDEIGSRS